MSETVGSVRTIGCAAAWLLGGLRGYRWFVGLIALYCGAALLIGHLAGAASVVSLSLYSESFVTVILAAIVVFFLGHAVYVMVVRRPEALTHAIVSDLRHTYLTPQRLASGLTVLILLPLFISAFTSFKSMIPLINPFHWDPAFAAWDRLLHGGVEPWRLLQPLFGYPLATSAVNAVYHAWFFVMFGVLFWQAFALSRPRLRMQFLLTFLLSWIVIGTVAATLLSSAGPVYFERVVGEDGGFGALLDYLRAANAHYPVLALDVHDKLWLRYQDGGTALGSGISAMPSMHVSMAYLFALVAWRFSRWLGLLFSVFALLILIGSVHLAWHYAIDGYLAVALTWVLWRLVGFGLERDAAFARQ